MKMGAYIKGAREFIYPPKHITPAISSTTPAVNTWVTVLENRNVEIYEACIMMATLAENLEFRMTLDGVVYTGSQAAAVAGQEYYLQLCMNEAGRYILPTAAGAIAGILRDGEKISCRAFKFEIRKTSANGANVLNGACMYAKY